MRIRDAVPGDAGALAAIYAPYVRDTAITFEYEPPTAGDFAARLERVQAAYPWLVLEEGGTLLGYAFGDRAFEKAAYAWCADVTIYLAPGARGQGRGRALYGALEQRLAAQGIRVLYALVTASNRASLDFHAALGYRQVGLLADSGWKLGQWHSVAWLEKRLGGREPPEPNRPRAKVKELPAPTQAECRVN